MALTGCNSSSLSVVGTVVVVPESLVAPLARPQRALACLLNEPRKCARSIYHQALSWSVVGVRLDGRVLPVCEPYGGRVHRTSALGSQVWCWLASTAQPSYARVIVTLEDIRSLSWATGAG